MYSITNLKLTNLIPLLPLAFELIYFCFSLTFVPPLLMAIVAFPALFILPGAMLLTILIKRISTNALQLVVEGFFVSTVIMVTLTSFMIALGLSLTSFNYSIMAISLVFILAIIGFVRKIEIQLNKQDILFIALAFTAYVILISFLSMFPRLFTADETSYTSLAKMGVSNGMIPPFGVAPNTSGVVALLQGRDFWSYLLASFLGSSGIPAYQAGLIGAGFLIMTALASSLMAKGRWLSAIVFLVVAFNPLLFSFSNLALNDLAITFYAVFAVLFFIRSFFKTGDNLSLNIVNLSYSLIGMIVLTLIKPDLLVFIVMWTILVFIILKYKLYNLNRKYKILSIAVLVPVLIYELCIDLPYVILVWVFRNSVIGDIFHKFLFISPIETFISWFIAPWWNPTASTIFTHNLVDYVGFFYRVLMPESSSLLISAIILALPILILAKDMRKEIDKTVLTSLALLSLYLFYFYALSSTNLSDVSRYSLWMIPLWIPLALIILRDMKDDSSFRKLFPVLIVGLILLWMNIYLSRENGGVYVGYDLPFGIWTADAITFQLITIMAILCLVFPRKDMAEAKLTCVRKLSLVKKINLKNAVFCLLILSILLNEVYFSSQFVAHSQLNENHGLTTISDSLDNLTDKGRLVFANNYIYMRPYVSDKIFGEGLLLPPPDTEAEFLNLINVVPNNTLFLISNDSATTWYEYGNRYIKNYADSEIITSDKPDMASLLQLNLSDARLHMAFDDANDTNVPDSSSSRNNGLNEGAQVVEGYSGKALQFNGGEYVAIPNDDSLNPQNAITISFLASIKAADPGKGYMILSKGYAPANGSYDIFIWNSDIYFELSSTNHLSFPVGEYLGGWHDFIFTYDGERMEALVDGVVVATESATGAIRPSSYDLDLGRDSERKEYFFNGTMDEIRISGEPLNLIEFIETYAKHYAIRVKTITGDTGDSVLFSTIVNEEKVDQSVIVRDSGISINENLTVTLELQIESPRSLNVTILIATDRFTKVYVTPLNSGLNYVKFQFDYLVGPSLPETGGYYWLNLDQTRLIVIDNYDVSYNKLITVQNLDLLNGYLLAVLLGTLAAYLLISFIGKKQWMLDGHAPMNGSNHIHLELR